MERQYYQWTAGASTVSVAFSPDVITRLRQAAETPDTEIGGILLGRKISDDQIAIEDFEILPSEHRRGATFTLSQADRKRLSNRLSASHNGLQNMGSFRTHIRQGLYMDQYDFDVMSSHFAAETDIMLLVRPADWQAGVFIWEEGDIQRQKSYKEFPFDSAQLPLSPLAIEAPQPVRAPARRFEPSLGFLRRFIPMITNVALVAATLGLAGVSTYYVRLHHPATVQAGVAPIQLNRTSVPPAAYVGAPVDPDVSGPKLDPTEMHVKLPDARPSPFVTVPLRPQADAPIHPKQKTLTQQSYRDVQAPVNPDAPPPIQSAANLPSVIPPVRLTPQSPQLISVVSLEPAEPGILSRGINRVPVLNLLQRNKFKAGDKFAAAKPVRQVKPRLPMDLEEAGPVDVKVWIDRSGQVTKAELLNGDGQPEVGEIASNAALKWTFEPARLSDRPVSSEMVMHFRFRPKSY
jgi:TonB family protein